MNLLPPSEVRALLRAMQFQPCKTLGQNFLIDANILKIILQTAAISRHDVVLEIGSGLGALTLPMAALARQVIAVEKDQRLHACLQQFASAHPNIKLIHGDMLQLELEPILASGVTQVVANLPYSTGSAMLVNFFQAQSPPPKITVTLQLEVAERLVAMPGTKNFGLLGLWCQAGYDTKIHKTIAPTCFYPAPQVQSAIIQMIAHQPPWRNAAEQHQFYTLSKYAFGRRRKQLITILRALPEAQIWEQSKLVTLLAKHNINAQARPENLSVAQWLDLIRILYFGQNKEQAGENLAMQSQIF